ncbi:MAG: sigma 54-interacting transcriptional regulator [Thermodesulfobacteriota bacterium]
MAKKQTEKELATLTCFYEITKVLASTRDLRECLKKAMAILSASFDFKNGTVTIVNTRSGQSEIEVAPGMTAQARKRGVYKFGEGITGRVIAAGEPIIVPRISEEPLFINRTKARGGVSDRNLSFLCVPIKHGKTTIGSLSVDLEYREGANFEEELQFLTVISGLLAQAVNRIQAVNKEKEELLYENTKLRQQLSDKYRIDSVVSSSSRMQDVLEMIGRVAGANATVLLRGESGTGKTLIAKAIHHNSQRADKPFVVVNCSALPETLLENELFGHEKGAFTGANEMKKGRFEVAEGGTLFLDEIGELPGHIQAKLLSVIQDREFQRLGSTRTRKCDVRLITATNKDLEKAVEQGTFREDFYYRLNVFPIYIPPLRDRRTDVLLLAEYFLHKYNEENKRKVQRISTSAIDLLIQYHWPGNVRELQNCMERALLICDGDAIKSYHLPPTLQTSELSGRKRKPLSLVATVENFEKELVVDALKRFEGNQTRAAAHLGASLRVFNYKVHKHKIDPNKFKIPKK